MFYWKILSRCNLNPDFDVNLRSLTESQSTVRVILLVMALSLHAVFEGLSLGLVGGMDEIIQVYAN